MTRAKQVFAAIAALTVVVATGAAAVFILNSDDPTTTTTPQAAVTTTLAPERVGETPTGQVPAGSPGTVPDTTATTVPVTTTTAPLTTTTDGREDALVPATTTTVPTTTTTGPAPGVVISVEGELAGTQEQHLSFRLVATGAQGVHHWSSDDLPYGLALDPGTGRVSGAPLFSGEQSFTVTVTDGTRTASKRLTLEVEPHG
ncbi:MAG: Ig domain-containing protein [Actinomycetes bacterium]|jgi:hypothetical protein